MLKRLKKAKARPPQDVNQLGRYLVEMTTGEKLEQPTKAELSKVMAALGQRGGKVGGKRRLETMTPEERSAVALKAARARWKKAKAKRTRVR
jgi:hypothetical protein